jgi:hypothetical protein
LFCYPKCLTPIKDNQAFRVESICGNYELQIKNFKKETSQIEKMLKKT